MSRGRGETEESYGVPSVDSCLPGTYMCGQHVSMGVGAWLWWSIGFSLFLLLASGGVMFVGVGADGSKGGLSTLPTTYLVRCL